MINLEHSSVGLVDASGLELEYGTTLVIFRLRFESHRRPFTSDFEKVANLLRA